MSEVKGGTSLEQFPKLVLKKIISFIPRQDDVNVRLICSIFKDLFDETIGVSWGKNCFADKQKTKLEDFEELPRCRSFDLFVDKANDCTISIPNFKSKRLLKSIRIGTEITDSSLNRFLTGLNSLETLALYQRAITNVSCSLYTKDLINLKQIWLVLYPVKSERLYFKLITFLKMAQFQNLQALIIEVNRPNCENIFCDALLTFLIQHQKTLSMLHIFMWFMNHDGREDWPYLPDMTHRLNQLGNSQIVKLKFLISYSYNSTQVSEIFSKIIENGKMVEEADECPLLFWPKGKKYPYIVLYDNYEDTFYTMLKPIPAQMIQNNYSTLVRIGMNIIPEDCHRLDCSFFSPCKSLEQLRLLTRQNSGAELVNVTTLPQTIRIFQVSNFLLKSKEIEAIATSYIGWECIFLGKAGTENGYGVTLSSFTSFITRRTQEIYIIDSWNLDDFKESLNHRGPLERIQALSLVESKEIEDGNGRYATAFNQPESIKPKRICMKFSAGSNKYEAVEVEDSASDNLSE